MHIPDGTEKEIVEDLIRQLREHGFQDDMEITEEVPVQQDKLTIAIPKESLTDTALENLQKIIANKQMLFQRAFRTAFCVHRAVARPAGFGRGHRRMAGKAGHCAPCAG